MSIEDTDPSMRAFEPFDPRYDPENSDDDSDDVESIPEGPLSVLTGYELELRSAGETEVLRVAESGGPWLLPSDNPSFRVTPHDGLTMILESLDARELEVQLIDGEGRSRTITGKRVPQDASELAEILGLSFAWRPLLETELPYDERRTAPPRGGGPRVEPDAIDDVRPSITAPPPPRKPWSALERIRFCPCCGMTNIDRTIQGSDGTCVCLECQTVFSVLAVAPEGSRGGGPGQ